MTAPAPAAVVRFELGDQLAPDRVEVRDAAGLVVLVCHPYTAGLWLEWHAAGPGGDRSWVVDNDYRVCACRHLCLSHSSILPDWTQAPGVGNGECAVAGCGCPGFRVVIAGPGIAGGNSVDVVDTVSVMA